MEARGLGGHEGGGGSEALRAKSRAASRQADLVRSRGSQGPLWPRGSGAELKDLEASSYGPIDEDAWLALVNDAPEGAAAGDG